MEKTDPVKRRLISELVDSKKNRAYFRRIADYMKKPSRKAPEVNVSKLDRMCQKGDEIVVPCKVLGFGEIGKKITVYSPCFSKQASDKIEKAGGKCMKMEDLLKSGKCPRIIV